MVSTESNLLTWTNTLLCEDQRETEGEIFPDVRSGQGLYLASGVAVFLLDLFAAVAGGRQPREVESARQGQQRSEEHQQRWSHGTANQKKGAQILLQHLPRHVAVL